MPKEIKQKFQIGEIVRHVSKARAGVKFPFYRIEGVFQDSLEASIKQFRDVVYYSKWLNNNGKTGEHDCYIYQKHIRHTMRNVAGDE